MKPCRGTWTTDGARKLVAELARDAERRASVNCYDRPFFTWLRFFSRRAARRPTQPYEELKINPSSQFGELMLNKIENSYSTRTKKATRSKRQCQSYSGRDFWSTAEGCFLTNCRTNRINRFRALQSGYVEKPK
jgi:hypothetical protein